MRVSEADFERVRELLPVGATLTVSPELDPGDVVVVTEAGELDARIEVQLEALARAMTRP